MRRQVAPVVRDAHGRPGLQWDLGAKLIDYQIIDEKEEDPNLRVQVKITLSQPGKTKNLEKKASYVVGTSPSVTVFRDIMRR